MVTRAFLYFESKDCRVSEFIKLTGEEVRGRANTVFDMYVFGGYSVWMIVTQTEGDVTIVIQEREHHAN